jgi:hypothetical protein
MKPPDNSDCPVRNGLPWVEVEDAAAKMCRVWRGEGELKWARECWGHLTAVGLTRDSTIVERTETLLRLVALASIYQEFSGLAWDEDSETPLDYLAEDLDIDAVALGLLAAAASEGEFDDVEDEVELRAAALQVAVDAQRASLFTCLSDAYGSSVALYSRMFKTHPEAENDGSCSEFEMTASNASALQYVTDGFRRG